MTTATLTLTYSVDPPVDDTLWVRLQQEGVADDVATVADTAAVFDALYNIEPCTQTESDEESASLTRTPLTHDDLTRAAAAIDYSLCDTEPDGSVTVAVRIIRSNPALPYVLRIRGGQVVGAQPGDAAVPVQVQEAYQQNLEVKTAASLVLDYPVVSGFVAAWVGPVVGGNGQSLRPSIQRVGTTLYWSDTVTGLLAVSFNTVYDLATIRVAGVNGEQGDCLVRCFYHGLVEELEPELPESTEMDRSLCPETIWQGDGVEDEVTCYQDVTILTLCECSREEISRRTEQQVQPCPEWAPIRCPNNNRECMHLLGSETTYEYVRCAGDNEYPGMPGRIYALSDPHFYEETCCTRPTVTLPNCPEKRESYRGGEPIALGARYYQDTYGPLTRLVPVSPPGGICGEHIIRQVIDSHNCCDIWVPIAINAEASPDVLPAPGRIYVSWSGGMPPFTVRTSAAGTWLQGGAREVSIDHPALFVHAGPTFCGVTRLTVEDVCGIAEYFIRSTIGRWERFYPPSPYCLGDYEIDGSGYEVSTVGAVKHVQESVCGGSNIYPNWTQWMPVGGYYPEGSYYYNRPAAYDVCVGITEDFCTNSAVPWTNPGGTVTVPNVWACYVDQVCYMGGAPTVTTSWQGDRIRCWFQTCGTFRDEYYRWVC